MISHIQLNVCALSVSEEFYLAALAPLGFVRADGQAGEYVRITNGKNAVIVLCPVEDKHRHRTHHRKGIGLSHFALSVGSRADVDAMERHLTTIGIPLLGDGKIETGYRHGYYCLLFEDPDRVMIEIVWHDAYYFSPLPP